MNTQRATLSHVTERGRVSARETEVSLAPCVRHTSNMHVHVHVYVHVQLQVHVPRASACEMECSCTVPPYTGLMLRW